MNVSLVIADMDWAAVGAACDAYNASQSRLDPAWTAIDPTTFLFGQIQTRLFDRWTQEQQDANQEALVSVVFHDPQILSQVQQLVATKQPPKGLINKNVP